MMTADRMAGEGKELCPHLALHPLTAPPPWLTFLLYLTDRRNSRNPEDQELRLLRPSAMTTIKIVTAITQSLVKPGLLPKSP
jgi:hypothetical protein